MDLMGKKWWFFALSTVIILPGLVSLYLYGLKLGIDFTGGTLFEYRFDREIPSKEVELVFKKNHLEVSQIIPLEMTQEATGSGYLIKTKPTDELQVSQIKSKFAQEFGIVEELRVESVGPLIGTETTKNAVMALVVSSVTIILYIAFAFRKVPRPTSPWRFGVTAVVALLHDILLLTGVFSLLGHYWGAEVDVLFITALLTVIGFSVHDTIVVFDRIRENLPKHLSKSFTEVTNISIVQTLGRSLNTSLTVVFVLLALLLFGGESIRWFVVALLVGIISGTYSSIFNATALLVVWEKRLGH